MLDLVQKYRDQLLLCIVIVVLLPTVVHLQEIILALGRYMGTILRMYVEGVCIK